MGLRLAAPPNFPWVEHLTLKEVHELEELSETKILPKQWRARYAQLSERRQAYAWRWRNLTND